ncbi:MAG: pyrroline-5-carboxylate reductase [Pirellulales bacterium]
MEKLAFIGGGQMAIALATGAIEAGIVADQNLVFAEPVESQRANLTFRFPAATVVSKATEAMPLSEIILLSVKPQVMPSVCRELSSPGNKKHLFISIAAGIPLAKLQEWLGTDRIIRVMPNTPCQIKAGASGISPAGGASAADVKEVEKLMEAVGTAVSVPEHLLHAVTGLSGSGPAYIYLVIEALSDAGVVQGLPRDLAVKLAAQTVFGAAKMVLETKLHTGVLRDQVTSPGGTTIAAIRELERAGVRSGIIEAVAAATERSKELAAS